MTVLSSSRRKVSLQQEIEIGFSILVTSLAKRRWEKEKFFQPLPLSPQKATGKCITSEPTSCNSNGKHKPLFLFRLSDHFGRDVL